MFLYYFSFKIRMWKKYFAIFFLLIFIFSTPLVSFASYHTKAIDNLVVDFTPIPTGVWPLDKIIKHKFIVKNSGTTSLTADFTISVIDPFDQVLGSITPEPTRLYLDPNENGTIIVKFDEKWGKLPASTSDSNPDPGEYERTIRVTFTDFNTQDTKSFDYVLKYTVLNKNSISGDFKVSGKVVDEYNQPLSGVNVILTTGNWETEVTTSSNGQFNFPGVPERDDWLIVASDNITVSIETKCDSRPPDPPCPLPPKKRAFAFVETSKTDYTLVLKEPILESTYKSSIQINTDMGFWTGDVDDNEQYVVLINGMENWGTVSASESKLYLFTLDGELKWTYDMIWEGWSTDISPDGKYVGFVNSNCGDKNIQNCEFGIISVENGDVLWTKKFKDVTVTEHPELSTKEIEFSNNSAYVAVGGVDGTLIMYDRVTSEILWTKFLYGQIRGVEFEKTDKFVYVGTGDRNAYKLNINDGSIVWTADIGSWPYVGAFKLSNDESLLASGGKYGDLTVVNTSDGSIHMFVDMIDIVSWLDFSPDDKYLVAGGGGQYATTLYDLTTGEKIWRIPKYSHQGSFSADGKFIIMGDTHLNIVDINGNDLQQELQISEDGCRPGCGGIFTYISNDGKTIIYTHRDMDTSTGIFFVTGEVKEKTFTSSTKSDKSTSTTDSNKLEPDQDHEERREPPKESEERREPPKESEEPKPAKEPEQVEMTSTSISQSVMKTETAALTTSIVATSPTARTTTTESQGGGCLIATAAFDSELSPEVQFLREFRDNTILNTNAGLNFMKVFNSFYYSFSPQVAEYERINTSFKEIIKYSIFPLIQILQIAESGYQITGNAEFGVILSGFIASMLIGLFYCSPLLLIIKKIRNFNTSSKIPILFMLLSLIGVVNGILINNSIFLMFITSLFVISTILCFSVLISNIIILIYKKIY